jgi:hypothetical protein
MYFQITSCALIILFTSAASARTLSQAQQECNDKQPRGPSQLACCTQRVEGDLLGLTKPIPSICLQPFSIRKSTVLLLSNRILKSP